MSADYTPAIWLPSPGRYWAGRQGGKPRYIILHGTAGGSDARAIGNWLNTQTEREPTSVHYVIGVNGQVVQLVSEQDSAWGNGVLSAGHDSWWTGNPNWYTVSIEHCKPNVDNSNLLSPAQQDASFALVRHLCERWGIPKRVFNPATPHDATVGVTGHFSIDPVSRKFCPGPYPWAQLFSYLNGGNTAMAWHEQPDHTGKDDKGHVCGQGVMALLAGRPDLASADGLMRERFRGGVDSVLPLANGHSVTAHHDVASGQWTVKQDDAGGLALLTGIISDQDAIIAAHQASQGDHQKLLQIKTIADTVQ